MEKVQNVNTKSTFMPFIYLLIYKFFWGKLNYFLFINL